MTGPDLQGEICIKTCQLFPGYLDLSQDVLDNEGYFHTGDLGYYDKDGIIHFVEQVNIKVSFFLFCFFNSFTLDFKSYFILDV